MKILALSTFREHDRTLEFYRLQRQFLDDTTEMYDHAIQLMGIENKEHYKHSIIVGPEWHRGKDGGHWFALKKLLAYAKEKRDRYDGFLILDSDAWPVENNWHDLLVKRMKDKFNIAASVRTENLERHYHPSIIFFKPEAFDDDTLRFKGGKNKNYPDLMFELRGDPRLECSQPVYPLIRTNAINIHPIFFGIYANLFYHHGAGSRLASLRAIDGYKYYKYIKRPGIIFNRNTKKLFKDPYSLIAKLRKLPE